jgi:hypothetical protein
MLAATCDFCLYQSVKMNIAPNICIDLLDTHFALSLQSVDNTALHPGAAYPYVNDVVATAISIWNFQGM